MSAPPDYDIFITEFERKADELEALKQTTMGNLVTVENNIDSYITTITTQLNSNTLAVTDAEYKQMEIDVLTLTNEKKRLNDELALIQQETVNLDALYKRYENAKGRCASLINDPFADILNKLTSIENNIDKAIVNNTPTAFGKRKTKRRH